jgi:hypothetical protein
MNVTELYALTFWIDNEIHNANIVNKYQELHTILSQNSQPNQQKQPFENQKDNLITSLRDVPLNTLTLDQLDFLEKLGIASL